MTRRQRQSQPKPVHKPLFCTRTEATRSIHAMSTSSNSVDPSLPVEPQPRSITSTSSYTQASQLRRFGGISLNSIVLSSTKQASGAQNQIEGLTFSLKTTMTQFNETAQTKYGANVEGIEGSALSNRLKPFFPLTIANSPTCLPARNFSVGPKPKSTPLMQGPNTESTITAMPQTHEHASASSFRKEVQTDQRMEPTVSLQDTQSQVGNAANKLNHVYQSVCKFESVPTVIPSLIPANTSTKPFGPELRLYQYRRGEELDYTLAELADEFVPTYLERDQMLEWLWKLESNRVRTYFGIQAGTLPRDVHMSPMIQVMNYEAVEITTSELLPFSHDRIRTAYNYVRIVLGANKDYVMNRSKPVIEAPRQQVRRQSANTKPIASTDVPARMHSMPANQVEVSPRSKYIPLFASNSAVTSLGRSGMPQTSMVEVLETGSTMDAPTVPATPKKKANSTSLKVLSPSSSIVDLLASDRDSPILAAIVKEWVQKKAHSKKASPTKPRKPRSKKLPTVDPEAELKQPGETKQGNALDSEFQSLLNEMANAELVSMSTIPSLNPSLDPFYNLELYFQTQPPVDFDSSFSATAPNLSFPPLTSDDLFAFDPIGLDLGSGSIGGASDFEQFGDFGDFGFQPDFSFLASGSSHALPDFSFGGIRNGMCSFPSSPIYDLGHNPAAMTLDQVEATQSMYLNDLLSL
ncbi:hypothetical protein BC830DRAFT_1220087 [Chytriomyces sp. MP71]|nr:hypothetical protein BC830DRAFT_1220087 [Chytriomyces sp. MP71]